MSASFRHVRLDVSPEDRITLWLEVADRKVNVFTAAVVEELQAALDHIAGLPDQRPLVFRSGKSSGFLAGADLRELAAFTQVAEVDRFLQRGRHLLGTLEHLARPTIAVIHGACLGGGLEFALACRLRIACDDAVTRLGLPETRLDLTPAWGGTRLLPRCVGLDVALRLMLTGESLGSADALALGLVDAAVVPADLDERIADLVRTASKLTTTAEGLPHSMTRFARLRRFSVARRRHGAGRRGSTAQRAVLAAVDAGYGDTGCDEARVVRDDFVCLLFSDECRQRLAAFLDGSRG